MRMYRIRRGMRYGILDGLIIDSGSLNHFSKEDYILREEEVFGI